MLIYLCPIIIFSFIAILYQCRILNPDNKFYAFALFSLGIFSGLRFQVGYDWQAYKEFFEEIKLADLIQLGGKYQFESGYYFLNYLVKLLGGSYSVVFLSASLFLSFALYKFTKHYLINNFYLLTIYLGYSFLLLNFALVRQSIAVGFFILGCNYYICHQNKIKSLLIASIGILFQVSSLIYVLLMAAVMLCEKLKPKWIFFCIIFFGVILYLSQFLDFDKLSSLFPGLYFFAKIANYKHNSATLNLLSSYFLYLIFLLFYLGHYISSVTPSQKFILQYALASISVSVLLGFVYPSSYVFYSRVYLVASIFQGYAMTLIFSANKGKLHTFVFILTLAVSVFYYWRILFINAESYIPYQTIFNL